MEELKRIRNERGWSQQKLADASGVNKATINQIEGGRRSPNVETLERLADALGVEVASFFPKAQPPLFGEAPEVSTDEERRKNAESVVKALLQAIEVQLEEAERRIREDKTDMYQYAPSLAERELRWWQMFEMLPELVPGIDMGDARVGALRMRLAVDFGSLVQEAWTAARNQLLNDPAEVFDLEAFEGRKRELDAEGASARMRARRPA